MGWYFDKTKSQDVSQTGTGGAIHVMVVIADSTGAVFSLDSCSQVETWTGNQLQKTTVTDPATGIVRVKTYSYDTSNRMVGETAWVPQ